MSKGRVRDYDLDFKMQVVTRMEAGANVSVLSRDLCVPRMTLYRWRNAYRRGGPAALRGTGRPGWASVATVASPLLAGCAEGPGATGAASVSGSAGGEAVALAAARSQIAALERKIGQQQLELDFFRQALRHLEMVSREPGVTASTPSSRCRRRRKAV